MKLFITLVVLVALAACDVSHIANSYLPPHSALSQSRTVSFSPSTGYSTGSSGAYTSSDVSSSSTSHGSSEYSGKLKVAPSVSQEFESGFSGSGNTGAGYTTNTKQIVQKTYSAPIIQTQTIQKSISAPSTFSSAGGSVSGSYTAQSPIAGSSFGGTYSTGSAYSTGTKQIIQKAYSAPIIQQQTVQKTLSAPSSFASSSDSVSAAYTAQSSPNVDTTYTSGGGYSTGTKQIIQKTYSAPIIQQQTVQKTLSSPSSFEPSSGRSVSAAYTAQSPNVDASYSTSGGYSTGTKQIVQETFRFRSHYPTADSSQNLVNFFLIYTIICSLPSSGITSAAYTAQSPNVGQSFATTYNSDSGYTTGAKQTVQKHTLPLLFNSRQFRKVSHLPWCIRLILLLLCKLIHLPANLMSAMKRLHLALQLSNKKKASYTASSPFAEKTTYTSHGSYTAPSKLKSTNVHSYQSVSAPGVQKTTFTAPIVQKTTYNAPASSQAYTTSGKSFTSYKSASSSPVLSQANTITEVQKHTYSAPLTQQSHTAPAKSYTNFKSVSTPAAQKLTTFSSPAIQKLQLYSSSCTAIIYQSWQIIYQLSVLFCAI
ncbi:hypothetical protein EVAR_70780_1 [Eumeta japonica]|uniref:Uncharacterized protein n=1 Tax=Eumeta variegata TaxID=151549 RepID=A0A4C1SZY3_EUMVA|nr:hypothetical protein EVAR_70780_1 [Eumeta japonica]